MSLGREGRDKASVRTFGCFVTCFLICLSLVLTARAPSFAADDVNEAIDAGIEFLLGEIQREQIPHWDEKKREPGQVALETYALVVAGVSVNHPLMRKNYDYLAKSATQSGYTYTLACYIFALDAAVAQLEYDLLLLEPPERRAAFRDDPRIGKEYRGHLDRAVRTLARMQNSKGAWHYGAPNDKFDNSNTQFAVLGLGAGAKRGVTVDPTVWRGIADHFLSYQQDNGKVVKGRLTMMTEEEKGRPKHTQTLKLVKKERRGGTSDTGGKSRERKEDEKEKETSRTRVEKRRTVDENPENPAVGTESIEIKARTWAYNAKGEKWSMACAGLSSLLLARENLRGKMTPDFQVALNRAIRDGYAYLMDRWSPTGVYYDMYSLEKVADIGGVKLFAGHDWYKELSTFLVKAQLGDGGWPEKGHGGRRVQTSFALLILNRATVTTLMTMDPLQRIMVSGRASLNENPNDRSWVYVPLLDTTIHYPTLLRTIRLRPLPKLIRFLENIVKSYPDEWKGELIPEMARVRDEVRNKTARKILEGYLGDITGFKYKEWEKYLQWHRRWERVMLIGAGKKKERKDDLLRYYHSTTKSTALKKSVMWALIQCKVKEAVPLFLADLEHADPVIRRAAYDSFRAFFIDFPPPFDATGPEKLRRSQVARIRSWYDRRQETAG